MNEDNLHPINDRLSTREEKSKLLGGGRGGVHWLVGLSGSDKSTPATDALPVRGAQLAGDHLRSLAPLFLAGGRGLPSRPARLDVLGVSRRAVELTPLSRLRVADVRSRVLLLLRSRRLVVEDFDGTPEPNLAAKSTSTRGWYQNEPCAHMLLLSNLHEFSIFTYFRKRLTILTIIFYKISCILF